MIVGIGTDVVEVGRIQEQFERYGNQFKQRIYTEIEQEYCERHIVTKFQHYAARFAFKEALSKALGTGVRDGFVFNECGISNDSHGAPLADLRGVLAQRYSHHSIHITLSHTEHYAVAFVVIESSAP